MNALPVSSIWYIVAQHVHVSELRAISETCSLIGTTVTSLWAEAIAVREIDLRSLSRKLQYNIPEERVDRILRAAHGDMWLMDHDAFKALVRTQLCLQRFRATHRGIVELGDVCDLLFRNMSPLLGPHHIRTREVLAYLGVHIAKLDDNVSNSIPRLQKLWREEAVNRCCIGSVLQLLATDVGCGGAMRLLLESLCPQ